MKKLDKVNRFMCGLRYIRAGLMVAGLMLTAVTPVFANDPIATINNMSDFIFSAIRAIGIIILAWGVVQIGMSLQSHDPSQRTNGFLTFFGGLVIALAKEILGLIGIA